MRVFGSSQIDHARAHAGNDPLNPRADRGLMVRSLMYLSIAGAIIACASVLMPHDPQLD